MKKSFTLIEIAMIVIIAGIIVTFATPIYRNALEKSKAEVCQMNLKELLGAVETYAVENDSLPSSLGQLDNKQLKKSWAKILKKENSWKIKLANLIVDFSQHGLAYAQEGWAKRYIGDLKYFTCPANDSTSISYGLNQDLAGKSYNEYRQLPKDSTTVIADSASGLFTIGESVKRHKKYTLTSTIYYAQEIKKSEKIEQQQQQQQQQQQLQQGTGQGGQGQGEQGSQSHR